jgi:hypothetical protein
VMMRLYLGWSWRANVEDGAYSLHVKESDLHAQVSERTKQYGWLNA